MANLDVSEVITCGLFTSPVRLIHMAEGYDAKGNPVWTQASYSDCMAVVTSDMKHIERLPEALRRSGSIVVRFMVGDAPEGFQGAGQDAVEWRGRRFTVVDCADYTQFGAGFLRLICNPAEAYDGSY